MTYFFNSFIKLFQIRSSALDVFFFSILIIILPIALITGPAIPDIIISLTAFYFLIKSIYKKYWNYYKNPIVIGCIFFINRSTLWVSFNICFLLDLIDEYSIND